MCEMIVNGIFDNEWAAGIWAWKRDVDHAAVVVMHPC